MARGWLCVKCHPAAKPFGDLFQDSRVDRTCRKHGVVTHLPEWMVNDWLALDLKDRYPSAFDSDGNQIADCPGHPLL